MSVSDQSTGSTPSRDESETDSKGTFSSLKFEEGVVLSPVGKYDAEYNMNHQSRGVAFIFNTENFKFLPPRPGTDTDCERLVKTFQKLGFEDENIRVCKDYTVLQMKNTIKKFVAEDHTKEDCVVVAVLTHGNFYHLYGSDGKLRIYELWEPFIADAAGGCPTLAGKPKIFFIQTCLGNQVDEGFEFGDAVDSAVTDKYKIPCHADFLICYATVPGYFSWRNEGKGSCFIQCLCDVFGEFSETEDVGTILTFVNQKVALEFESFVPDDPRMNKKKQMPCYMSMLTRKVYFRVKNTTGEGKVQSMDISP